MDLVIYRENTEGFYPDRNMYQGVGEMMPDPDMALSVERLRVGAVCVSVDKHFQPQQRVEKKSQRFTKQTCFS